MQAHVRWRVTGSNGGTSDLKAACRRRAARGALLSRGSLRAQRIASACRASREGCCFAAAQTRNKTQPAPSAALHNHNPTRLRYCAITRAPKASLSAYRHRLQKARAPRRQLSTLCYPNLALPVPPTSERGKPRDRRHHHDGHDGHGLQPRGGCSRRDAAGCPSSVVAAALAAGRDRWPWLAPPAPDQQRLQGLSAGAAQALDVVGVDRQVCGFEGVAAARRVQQHAVFLLLVFRDTLDAACHRMLRPLLVSPLPPPSNPIMDSTATLLNYAPQVERRRGRLARPRRRALVRRRRVSAALHMLRCVLRAVRGDALLLGVLCCAAASGLSHD